MNLIEQVQSMPTLGCALPFQGFIRYREAGEPKKGEPSLILLHGIGSGSGSWVHQLQAAQAAQAAHCLAWDAPGYADSTPLSAPLPQAADYARVLWGWLDELQIANVHLVGHSLGCLMAASAARLRPERVAQLTLLAPAQGYGPASEEVRNKKRDERLQAMHALGLQKMAEQRAPRLLSPQASSEQIALATLMMSRLNEGGYTQATHMLSGADIRSDVQSFKKSSTAAITVACGEQDVITPAKACRELAAFIGAPYRSLGEVGHLCAVEGAQAVNHLLHLNGASA